MVKKHPNTSKGQHRETEVSIAAWIDLLGYGAMLEKSSFEPFSPATRNAINRIDLFHQEIAKKSSKVFPSMAMNDGAVIFKDLSPRSKESSFDFLYRAFKLYSHINGIERSNGFPGARMVIATGFRIRRKTSIRAHLKNGIGKYIINKVHMGEMNIEEAVLYALMTRPIFDVFPELQANFAFAKAYIADAGGSKKGLAGPNCFIDLSLFDTNLPDWLRLKEIIDWSDRGLTAQFGILDGIHKTVARKNKFDGILDAFEVALKISNDKKILDNLRKTKIIRYDS